MDEEFGSWLAAKISQGDTVSKLRCVATCWSVWRGRNDVVWNNKPWNLPRIQFDISRLVNDWQEVATVEAYNGNQITTPGADFVIPAGAVRVCVDAAVFSELGLAYYGVVILDRDGGFIAAKNGPLRCLNDAHLAEALAIKEALSWVKDRGFLKIVVCSDCQTVCNLINGSSVDYSYAGCVINECKNYKRHFESVSFRFISRSVNKSAHALARATRSQTDACCWISSIPFCIQHLI